MGIVEINRSVLISLVVLFETSTYKSKYNFLQLSTNSILKCTATAAVPAAKENMESLRVKALRSNSTLEMSQFLSNEKLAPRKLRTEQISEALRATLAVRTCALKDGRI